MSGQDQPANTDLWGRPFVLETSDSAPVALLRQQADALTARTQGRVEEVVFKKFDKGTAWASLYARVPALQGYMYKLLTVAHSPTADPVNPTSMTVHDTLRGSEDWKQVDSMDQLTTWLAEALSSDQAHAVIDNLLRYVPEEAAT